MRLIAHAIRAGVGPFHNISAGQTHIHHLVWGIMLLLVVGYGWIIAVGEGEGRRSSTAARLMALLYGAGAAMTLDEFALLLYLEDVYWVRKGRASIDAVILFGSVISAGYLAGPFLRAVFREVTRLRRRR